MRCPQCNQYLPDRCTCNGLSKEQQVIAGITVTLDAASLYSKWGFSDGDLLSGAFYAMKITGIRQRDVLAQLVEERLLPALPYPVKTERIDTAHNPIRVEDAHHSDGSYEANGNVIVFVTYGEVAACAERMRAEIEAIARARLLAAPLIDEMVDPGIQDPKLRAAWKAATFAKRYCLLYSRAMGPTTGRRTGASPAFSAPYTGATPPGGLETHGLASLDYGELELKILGRHSGQYLAAAAAQRRRRPSYDSPVGPHAGRIEVWSERGLLCTFGLSGNARQRRRTIRQLKADFIIRQTNALTGAIITR
jgi:hypothetical protein